MTPEESKLESLKLWLNFAKFLLGTVAIGVITATLNYQIQQKELILKEKDLQQQYLKNFIEEALDENLEKRVRFSHYFSTLLQDKWIQYYTDLKTELSEKRVLLKEKEANLQKTQQPRADQLTEQQSPIALKREVAQLLSDITPQGIEIYEQFYAELKTDELELSMLGETAFNQGHYDRAVKFLEQADAVSSSGVWKSSYPFLIASYLLLGETDKASAAVSRMYEEIDKPYGYLANETPIDFLLDNFKEVRMRVGEKNHSEIDKIVNEIIKRKKVARQQAETRENIRNREGASD